MCNVCHLCSTIPASLVGVVSVFPVLLSVCLLCTVCSWSVHLSCSFLFSLFGNHVFPICLQLMTTQMSPSSVSGSCSINLDKPDTAIIFLKKTHIMSPSLVLSPFSRLPHCRFSPDLSIHWPTNQAKCQQYYFIWTVELVEHLTSVASAPSGDPLREKLRSLHKPHRHVLCPKTHDQFEVKNNRSLVSWYWKGGK